MSNTQSGEKKPHELFKENDDLCAEIDVGLANQLPDKAVTDLRRWIRRSLSRSNECLLAVQERNGLTESCMAFLSTNGYTVVTKKSVEIRGREALMLWQSELRNLPAPSAETCFFVRGLNLLNVAEQQGLWSSWTNILSSTSTVRFAYSFEPFAKPPLCV